LVNGTKDTPRVHSLPPTTFDNTPRIFAGVKNGLPTWIGTYSCTGYGRGGGLDGHSMEITKVVTMHDPTSPQFEGEFWGVIQEQQK
jgi:hypothetical protein